MNNLIKLRYLGFPFKPEIVISTELWV